MGEVKPPGDDARLPTTLVRQSGDLAQDPVARTQPFPVTRWHELIGDPTIGDAILDRIVHRAHRIELKGPSLRDRNAVGGGGMAAAT